MQQVKSGDTVKIHYHGTLTDGTIFDSSLSREPLEFEAGSGMVIPGFDAGVMNMSVGDKKTLNIPCQEAYGATNPEMVMEFGNENLPADMKPEIGMQLTMGNQEGQQFQVVVTEIKEASIVIDANHPLAGKDLIFEIELMELTPKSMIIMP
jgi:FKBP-type peptidyl-prolyl cis-trans isomerase 2